MYATYVFSLKNDANNIILGIPQTAALSMLETAQEYSVAPPRDVKFGL